MAKTTKKSPTKTEVYTAIAEECDLSKKQVAAVFDSMNAQIEKALGRGGPKMFTIPGLCKIVLQHKPATPARKGVPNPFKPGELMDVAAKPARNLVKVRALKNLKDMA